MRYPFQDIFRDGTAAVVPAGIITVFQAGTSTPAKLYAASAGGTSVAFVTADDNGFFSFWVDDGDYMGRYKLVLSKTNITTTAYDNVVIQNVDTSSGQTLSNKTLTLATLSSPAINGTVSGGATYTAPTMTSPVINTGVSGTAVDNTATLGTSATVLPTQGAAKHYADRIGKVSAQKMLFNQIFG